MEILQFIHISIFRLGLLNVVCTSETNKPNKITTTKQIADDTTAAASASAATADGIAKEVSATSDATKDKRQTKDTKDAGNGYANHRSDSISSSNGNSRSSSVSDDPEDPQETIYGTDGRQFLIRPQQSQQQLSDDDQQQQQQQEQEQRQQQQQQHQHHRHQHLQVAQLRNYPVTIRPHSSQLLEQSQEVSTTSFTRCIRVYKI